MIAYLANQIILGALIYQQIITARSDLQESIDTYIEENSLDIDTTI